MLMIVHKEKRYFDCKLQEYSGEESFLFATLWDVPYQKLGSYRMFYYYHYCYKNNSNN